MKGKTMTAIEELYAGNIRPTSRPCLSEKYRTAQSEQDKYYSEIEELLPENERSTLEKLWDSTADMEYEMGLEMFKTGFALGVRLTAECYNKNKP